MSAAQQAALADSSPARSNPAQSPFSVLNADFADSDFISEYFGGAYDVICYEYSGESRGPGDRH
jgi:hypothetical protein